MSVFLAHVLTSVILIWGIMLGATGQVTAEAGASCDDPDVAITVIDEYGVPTRDTGGLITGPLFETHVGTVTAHVRAACASMPTCDRVSLVFRQIPLVTRGSGPFMAAEPPPAPDARRLESPWATLTLDRSTCAVHGVFTWSERQFLLDQAMIADPTIRFGQDPPPLAESEFQGFLKDYVESVLLAPSPEAKQAAQQAISARIPPDLLWLYRQTWQSTLAPFENAVGSDLAATIQRAAPGYTDLTLHLIDLLFDQTADTTLVYDDITELGQVIRMDGYGIGKLH